MYNRQTTNTPDVNAAIGLRIELYNRAIDPTLSSPLAFTNKISSGVFVYRYDFPAISTYPSGSFVSADSTTQITSGALISTDITFENVIDTRRTGLKIEHAGLEVGGNVTFNGKLQNTTYDIVNIYHSPSTSISNSFTFSGTTTFTSLTITPQSVNSILSISGRVTTEKSGGNYYSVAFYMNDTVIEQLTNAMHLGLANGIRQIASGTALYSPNTISSITIRIRIIDIGTGFSGFVRGAGLQIIEFRGF